jgi:hypothetical protein
MSVSGLFATLLLTRVSAFADMRFTHALARRRRVRGAPRGTRFTCNGDPALAFARAADSRYWVDELLHARLLALDTETACAPLTLPLPAQPSWTTTGLGCVNART